MLLSVVSIALQAASAHPLLGSRPIPVSLLSPLFATHPSFAPLTPLFATHFQKNSGSSPTSSTPANLQSALTPLESMNAKKARRDGRIASQSCFRLSTVDCRLFTAANHEPRRTPHCIPPRAGARCGVCIVLSSTDFSLCSSRPETCPPLPVSKYLSGQGPNNR